MGSQEIILEYRGHLTFSTIGRLLTILKKKMKANGIQLGIYKKILSVMIEVLENVYKYSDQYQHIHFISRHYIPYFKITRNETSYYIYCSNPVKNEHVPYLERKLETVNSKNLEELKLLYRQTIANGKFSSKGGAGLGIIEMAKISNNPLEYKFEEINKDFSFFSLKIKFN